ncbi:MAG: polyisoprenoid-binding protein [Flavobacteriales bacterium]|nr:polyisoprenoid-binding protein [Flavobacteriales bacterium]|tara:strand:+ start:1528 stop:2055 length:528 start_codon:yes stop_codon:yes gene_type:complete
MRFILIFLLPFSCLSQKMFVENSQVSFFSSAPLEDISALSNKLEGVVDFSSGTFFFRIPINTFIFPSSLMQKHFNEKYMESETYTISSFKGNFKEKVNIYENQLLTIHADGVLNMHGINKEVSIKTDLLINNNVPKFSSEFNVILKDFSIKIPKIVRMNIADTILVNVSGNLVVK